MNNEKIQKPVSVVLDETRGKLIAAISESNLHASLLEMIVKELYLEIRNQAEMIAIREKTEYEESIKEQKDSEPAIN